MGIDTHTPLSTPESASLDFAEALSAGDLDTAASYFARDACFLTPDATAIWGREEIRAVLAQLIGMRLQIRVDLRNLLTIGDIALSSERWTMRFEAADGTSFTQTSRSTAALRLIESQWKLLIAAPWGWR